MYLTAIIKTEDGETVALIPLAPKTFRSGKVGYFGQGKALVDGERHQLQCQAVKIKSNLAQPESTTG